MTEQSKAIHATLCIFSTDLCQSIQERISVVNEFTTVTDNDPSAIQPLGLGLLSLDTFISSEELRITHIGIIRKGVRVSTGQVRIKVTDVFEFPKAIPIDQVVSSMAPKFRKNAKQSFSIGYKKVSPKIGELLFEKMIELYPDHQNIFNRLHNKISGGKIKYSTPRIADAATEKDALGVALDIFGVDRSDILRSWEANGDGSTGNSFLSGIQQYYSYEDDIINNDLRTLPGMQFVAENISGIAEFRNDQGEKLTVINANRKPLERAMGVDLIYYHRYYDAFTFVQYKMMGDRTPDSEAYYYTNEPSHEKELERMNGMMSRFKEAPLSSTLSDYRLGSCPIFFKVCKRIQLKQNDGSIVPGAYIPLDHWNILLADPSTKGKMGERRIGFQNLQKKYLGTQTFVDLVQRGLIGTQSTNSKPIALFIEEAIKRGNSVMYAVDHSTKKRRDYDSERRIDNDLGLND